MATSLSFDANARTALNFSRGHSTAAPVIQKPDGHGRELFLNHIWESLNAAAKILFFAVLTPMMLSAWGKEQFGLFAVANACVALMAFLDLGLRTLTRLGLTNPTLPESAKVRLHALNVAAFSLAAGAGVAVVVLLAVAGVWHRWLHLPPTGDVVIAVTAVLTAAMMWLQLLLERIAAAGRLSQIKAALFAGNLLAFALVFTLLHRGAALANVTTVYFAALAFPLLFLLPLAGLRAAEFLRVLFRLRPTEIFSTIKSGGFINLITASWIFQSYGLVLLISCFVGPAAAGTFFLFLKLSELLSVLGASASEPIIAALAGAATAQDRQRHFATGYKSAIALCLTGAVGYTFFCGDLFRIWLHRSLDHSYTGLLIGLFGIAAGFTRMITTASLGVGKPRAAALGLFAGAILVAGTIVAFRGNGGAELILAAGFIAAVFVVPAAQILAREFGSHFRKVWIEPVIRFTPALLIIIAVCAAASRIGNLTAAATAIVGSALICGRHIFARFDKSLPSETNASRLGYDTRSWRSALVMRSIDLLNPFRHARTFAWSGPCVVSSVAGLGDLFIHLPLIAGIVNESRRRGIETQVALRPVHADIGALCDWNVLSFDNALEDFFKKPTSLQPFSLLRRIREARRHHVDLWIDLTGNAVGALAIKLAGARKLTARVTRGGRSLINHQLPHALHENEYENVARVAAALGCEPDHSVFDRLRGEPLPGLENCVVLSLTTACRWRNWPLRNFLALIDRFPHVQFAIVGFDAEIAAEERDMLEAIRQRPNVTSLMDKMSILHLIRLIAHARAVITNDTGAAHIATAFRKPGAILFGPASPDKLAAPYGPKTFVDRTCPFHPCVQWTCRNQENWCMRKIEVAPVAEHLAAVLEETPFTRPQPIALEPTTLPPLAAAAPSIG
jgi:ADP-heptose:LPS heptosyltransferase/O-antigen/teichoic acid export membrane protein